MKPLIAHFIKLIKGISYDETSNSWLCPLGAEDDVRSFAEFCEKKKLTGPLIEVTDEKSIHQRYADMMKPVELPQMLHSSPTSIS